MTNKKTTKRALALSIISMLICVVMLAGTTFAWFTDSVVSGRNQILAGNLDVELYRNGTDSVEEDDALFLDKNGKAVLWEPGVCVWENLTVKNAGTLALKYKLNLTVFDETKTPDGESLADVIKVGYVENGVDANASREDVVKSITSWGDISDIADAGVLYPAGNADNKASEKTTGVVLYWAPSAIDNNYNMNNENQDVELNIEFGLNLIATQVEYESDSFDELYDKNAPVFVWDGSVDTSWYSASENEFELTTPAQLAGLASLVNAGNTFAGKSIKLGADMDLNNLEWTPIGVKNANFNGNIYGGGYTIYNLNVKGTEGVGLIGIAGNAAHIEGIHVDGASVSGTHYVGTVVGYAYLAKDCLRNCTVENATVVCEDDGNGNGDKVGAVAGWTSNGDIVGNKAVNCTVFGCRDMGGIVGYVNGENRAVKVTSNTVTDVTLAVLDVEDYDKLGTNVEDTAGRTGTRVTVTGNEGECTIISNTVVADNNDELKNALKNGAYIKLADGEFSLGTLASYEGVTIIGSEGTVIGGKNASTGFGGNFGKDTTIKNVTFSGSSNGVRYSYANGGTSVFENCTFAGDSMYGFHIDESYGATFTFNNCTFSGFNAFAGDLEKVTFNNCTFLHNGNYGHTNIWSVGEFNNCTWGDKASVSPAGSGKLYFNGVEESYHHEYVGSAESLVAFAKSVNEGNDPWKGQNVSLVADIDLAGIDWEPIGQTGATEFKGIFDGQGYTISNLNVDSSEQTGEHYSSGLFGWSESGSTIKNVNVDGAKVVGNHNVAVIVGYTYSSKIINCNVTNAQIVCNHANGDACGDKVGLIVGYAGDESRITNCSGADSTVSAGRDGGQLIGAGYNVSVSGCSASNVAVSANGTCDEEANVNNALIGRVLG